MITLIAESKTMQERELTVNPEFFNAHRPAGEAIADEIMHNLQAMSLTEIASVIKISGQSASKVIKMAYEFPNKTLGIRAIDAFTGVVFRALNYETLPESAKASLEKTTGIISSLYGFLNPTDIIKPYRFDFKARLSPSGQPAWEIMRKNATISLVKLIQKRGETVVLNLLPGDASKCIDWKLLKRFAKVYKIDFKELKDGGDFTTPNAGKLKTMRGLLLRTIALEGITNPADIISLETDALLPLGTPDYPDHIAFCV